MCGIVAILKKPSINVAERTLYAMQQILAHRGPDDWGIVRLGADCRNWREFPEGSVGWQVGLAHRRLSILDLRSTGHQPMQYMGKYWISYNGEIYNYIELRNELEKKGFTFHSKTDTEVILAAYAHWGTDCFARFRGMWAIVLVDTVYEICVISRDRLGIKPLYYWKSSDKIVFASEIKAFLELEDFKTKINLNQMYSFINTGYEDQYVSYLENITPIPPGSFQTVSLRETKLTSPQPYWFPDRIEPSIEDPSEAAKLVAAKFEECVKLHLRSDVPVGCALSGGIDSSSIALMIDRLHKGQADPLHTFSCVFPGMKIDETDYINAVTSSIYARPFTVTPTPEGFLKDLDRFIWMQDEPIGGLSIYAGYCIARLTREAGVPVTLNGQGGDEILSGYWQSYFYYLRCLIVGGSPLKTIQHFAGSLLGKGNPDLVRQIPHMLARYYSRRYAPCLTVKGLKKSATPKNQISKVLEFGNNTAWRVFEIREMFLPRLLRYEDRNCMAFSVEGRYPFLDHEVIELCLSFSMEVMYKNGWTKVPIREGLKDLLPQQIRYRRSKIGFEVPQDQWISGPMREMLKQWLNGNRPIFEYVEKSEIAKLHESGWKQKRPDIDQTIFRLYAMDKWLELYLR